jgi:hypothetical protein
VSLRVWTAEELARVWPLPGDWVWHSEPGRDSVEAFVAEMESAAEQCRASALAADADACLSAAIAFEVCADGLRLGVAKR